MKAIGSDPRWAHGLAPVLVLADEPAQWLESTSGKMLVVLETAMGKIPGSRMIALGTQPALAGHWFARWLNGDADYRQSHIANPLAPPFQRRTWLKANPSLPYMPGLELTIRKQARKARTSDDALAAFRALRLNCWQPAKMAQCETREIRGRIGVS